MKTISMKEYNSQKRDFYTKHSGDRGPREVSECTGGIITKEVSFEDGHTWNEISTPHTETITIESHGLKIPVTVKMYKTEIWDSGNSISRCLYDYLN